MRTVEYEHYTGIDVSQLSQGTYILKMYTSDGLVIRKFVKS